MSYISAANIARITHYISTSNYDKCIIPILESSNHISLIVRLCFYTTDTISQYIKEWWCFVEIVLLCNSGYVF